MCKTKHECFVTDVSIHTKKAHHLNVQPILNPDEQGQAIVRMTSLHFMGSLSHLGTAVFHEDARTAHLTGIYTMKGFQIQCREIALMK